MLIALQVGVRAVPGKIECAFAVIQTKRNILSLVLQNVQASDTFNLLEMQHYRRLTPEKRHQHRYPSLIHINIGDGPCLTCPRAIKVAYTLTYREMTHSLLLCGNFLGLLHYLLSR